MFGGGGQRTQGPRALEGTGAFKLLELSLSLYTHTSGYDTHIPILQVHSKVLFSSLKELFILERQMQVGPVIINPIFQMRKQRPRAVK